MRQSFWKKFFLMMPPRSRICPLFLLSACLALFFCGCLPRPEAAGRPVSQRISSPDAADCGPRALFLICQEQGVLSSLAELRRTAGTTVKGTTLAGLAKAAKAQGWKAAGVQVDRQALAQMSGPAIAWIDGDHYIAVLSVSGDTATVHDPNKPQKEEMALDDLLRRCGGIVLTLSR